MPVYRVTATHTIEYVVLAESAAAAADGKWALEVHCDVGRSPHFLCDATEIRTLEEAPEGWGKNALVYGPHTDDTTLGAALARGEQELRP